MSKNEIKGRKRGEVAAVVITEDYYRILQVHYLAEPEVIESAYKRLAKKYHPDVSSAGDAETRMKKINEAYEILRDAKKRRDYDAQRRLNRPSAPPPPRSQPPRPNTPPKRPQGEKAAAPQPAVDALTRYFNCIKARDYDGAYHLLTHQDKTKISRADFAKWQTNVARIYALQEYSVTPEQVLSDAPLGGRRFRTLVRFSVKTIEKNFVMERLEKDLFTKTVVLEGDSWHVYAGHEDIKPFIARYEELSKLVVAKSALGFLLEQYSLRDVTTGLFTRKGFLAEAERELERNRRYGNPFSLVLLTLRHPALHDEGLKNALAEWCGKTLQKNIRILDIAARWSDTSFLLLLPETRFYRACRAAKKLLHKLEKAPPLYRGRREEITLHFAVDEYAPSLEKTLARLTELAALAKDTPQNLILTRRGRFE
ncbi:MAG TPA: DnaJ domain-containing protein [Papillibacter sp.]|nr:DnaJ domain-containing protein [Papillibacter sp.]